jgi:hypothetical protein
MKKYTYEFVIKSLASIFLVAMILLAGCTKSVEQQPEAPQLTPQKSAEATQALVEWFECEECEAGELSAVTEYGEAVVPILISTLNQGPSPASRELVRRELETRYDELSSYSKEHPNVELASSKEEFVTIYLSNYVALYRVRAALALGAIGGKNAEEALESALKDADRDVVRSSIQHALNNINQSGN